MEFWELVARERIRDSLARYNWSGDSLRIDELAESFCEDGELQLRGEEPIHGRAAISAFIGGVAAPTGKLAAGPQIVRHNLTNTRFLELSPERPASRRTSPCSPTPDSTITAATVTPSSRWATSG